jgi:hypothetical protein
MKRIATAIAALCLLVSCGSSSTADGGGDGSPVIPPGGDSTVLPNDDDGATTTEDALPPDPDCEDKDGDGFGVNCLKGPDCDETNPHLAAYCPPCDAAIYAGCPCVNEGASIACYSGDPAYLGIGECVPGQQQCAGGYWTECVGSVEPAVETCDGLDNNCDGETDEGVLSPCGDCNEKCEHMGAGPGKSYKFGPEKENSSGVSENVDGYIVLDSEKVNMQFIWIANSGESTVSKFDTATGMEMGRYNVCSNPSRTSVDLYGDVWVGCRNDGGVAKVVAYKGKCQDKNGNGSIETSEDKNGDGHISGDEMMGGDDECIKFVVHPGGSCIRSAGVDKDNHVWVGDWDGASLHRLAPADGAKVDSIDISCNPYGLVIDSKGIIWVAGRGCSKLVRVDPATHQFQHLDPGCISPYGISLDNKGRVWVANNGCGGSVAYRYDPANGSWASAQTQSSPRGIVGSLDGFVYVANDGSSKVAVVNADSAQTQGYIDLGGGRSPVGITIDFTGFVWAVNQGTSSTTKIDSKTWQIVGEYQTGSGPYTYSDMTGYLLHTFTNPTGYYQHLFGTEGIRLSWLAIIVDAYTPVGTYIKVRVRAAVGKAELDQTPWSEYFGPFPPGAFPLDISPLNLAGAYLQVEVSLYSDVDGQTPIVKSIEVKFESGEGQ